MGMKNQSRPLVSPRNYKGVTSSRIRDERSFGMATENVLHTLSIQAQYSTNPGYGVSAGISG
jgi:hypothetical protein